MPPLKGLSYCAINGKGSDVGFAFALGTDKALAVFANPSKMVNDYTPTLSASSQGAFVLTLTTISNGVTSTAIGAGGNNSLTTGVEISATGLTTSAIYRCVLKNGEYLLVSR